MSTPTKKYKLLADVMGRRAGTIVTIHSDGVRNKVVIDPNGDHITVPCEALEEIQEDTPAPVRDKVVAFERAEEPLVEPLVVTPEIEIAARQAYDNYCEAVGGKAFNGDPLPHSDEFFEDPKKQKQANGYRVMIEKAYERFVEAAVQGGTVCDPVTMRAKVLVVRAEQSADQQNEFLGFRAVPKPDGYGADGLDEDNTYALYSPTFDIDAVVANPALLGKLKRGEKYYVEFIKAEDAPPAEEPGAMLEEKTVEPLVEESVPDGGNSEKEPGGDPSGLTDAPEVVTSEDEPPASTESAGPETSTSTDEPESAKEEASRTSTPSE